MSHALSSSTVDPHIQHTILLLDRIFPPPRSFQIRLWNGGELPAAGGAPFRLVFNHPGAVRRMFSPPIELSLGEAFIYGDFEIEGDIIASFSLYDALRQRTFSTGDLLALARDWLALPKSDVTRLTGRGSAQIRGAIHSRERDRAAIGYHYNVGNEFYALWLDRRMQYSCGYFPTGAEDIDAAQECKLEHICRKLRLKPGERVLDIGCGWGGLALYAAEKYGVEVLGVTLSDKQVEYANVQIARAGLSDRVQIKLQDYRDLQSESFDKLVSVGMFEHVGRSHLPEYFAQTYRLLKPGGLFLNHGISIWPGAWPAGARPGGWQRFIERRLVGSGLFSQHYIFPDGELEPVSEVNLMAERAGFEVRDVENLREHYALTLRHWLKRLEQQRDDVIRLTDEVTFRTWRIFLASSAYGFESADINVNQSLLSKTVDGKSSAPLTRADLYV
jgi:cyclopropane-fatty-acyl-phospholipid synthase